MNFFGVILVYTFNPFLMVGARMSHEKRRLLETPMFPLHVGIRKVDLWIWLVVTVENCLPIIRCFVLLLENWDQQKSGKQLSFNRQFQKNLGGFYYITKLSEEMKLCKDKLALIDT